MRILVRIIASADGSRPSSPRYLDAAERSRLQAFQNQQQLISQPGLRRRLASERRQRLIQLLINGLRILVTALATALFFRMLAQPSDQLLARSLKEK